MKKVLVIGATGGSGVAAVQNLLARGCEVTAFARRPGALAHLQADPQHGGRLTLQAGDAMNPADIDSAVPGHDAVVVTLGISENPVRVRLRGSAGTPMNVRSQGTRHVIDAMRRHGVRKLVAQTTFGAGATRGKLPFIYKLMFSLLLKPQIADTEQQEEAVRASGLDWVLAQPVNLTDDDVADAPLASAEGAYRSMKIARRQVGQFLADAAVSARFNLASVALSA